MHVPNVYISPKNAGKQPPDSCTPFSPEIDNRIAALPGLILTVATRIGELARIYGREFENQIISPKARPFDRE